RGGGAPQGEMLRRAVGPLGIPVLGCLPRDEAFSLPERHLGLVQASEHQDIDRFLDAAASRLEGLLDVETFLALAGAAPTSKALPLDCPGPPLARHIPGPKDPAFPFAYPTHSQGR